MLEKLKKIGSTAFRLASYWLLFSVISYITPVALAFVNTTTLDTLVFKNEQGKTVVLQGMSHIAPNDFFTHVNSNIKEFLETNPNSKVFTEGVKVNKDTNLNQVNNVMSDFTALNGDLDLTYYYRSIAKFTGMQYESDSDYLNNISKDILVNADLSGDDFLKAYNEQKSIKGEQKSGSDNAMTKKEIDDMLENKDSPFAYFKKLSYKASLKNAISNVQEAKCNNTNDLMTSVLLDERNRNLINMIENETSDVFVTYGSAHLYCGNVPLVSALKDRGYTLVSVRKYKYEM